MAGGTRWWERADGASLRPVTDRFHLRRGTVDDVDDVLALFVEVAAEGWLGTEPGFDREARASRMRERLAGDAPAATFLAVADDPGEATGPAPPLIGNLGIDLASYGVAHLGMLVVEGWRGRGVGGALLDAAVAWAGTAGAHKVALELWPHNDGARRLYASRGFVEEGYLRRHYRRRDGSLWDAAIMGLVLDQTTPGGPPGRARRPPAGRR